MTSLTLGERGEPEIGPFVLFFQSECYVKISSAENDV